MQLGPAVNFSYYSYCDVLARIWNDIESLSVRLHRVPEEKSIGIVKNDPSEGDLSRTGLHI